MTCRLLPEPMLIVNWILRNTFQWNWDQNTKLFVHKKSFENVVYEMAATLSRGLTRTISSVTGTGWHVVEKTKVYIDEHLREKNGDGTLHVVKYP